MGAYADPICFQFYFGAVTDKAEEPVLQHAFLKLVEVCKDWLIQDGNRGKEYPLGLTSIHGENRIRNHWLFQGKHTIESVDTSICEKILKEDECNYITFSRDLMTKPIITTSAGKFGKKCERLLKKTHIEQIDDLYISELSKMLSCPSDKLEEVRVPLSMLRGFDMFDITYHYYPAIINQNDRGIIIPSRYESNITTKLHEIFLRIPRFLIGQETSILTIQDEWKKELLSLGSQYSYSTGSITMDSTFRQSGAFSFYDAAFTKYKLSNRYIPGYCWGMLINAEQTKLLPDELPDFFNCVKNLENGSRYYQLTEDMRCITRLQGTLLREYFRKSLPPEPLGILWDEVPRSFRLCITPEEIKTKIKDLRHLELVQIIS